MEDGERVLQFWFGQLDKDGLASSAKSGRWFQKDPDFDREIREEFGALHALLLGGERPAWSLSPRGTVASVVVLDQFSRNIFRGTGAMFVADQRALAFSLEAIALGLDRSGPAAHRSLLYMPLMHAEDVRMQRRCVELFEAFAVEAEGPAAAQAERSLKYAVAHREIVERFGRFPHRNELLGRTSTPEEVQFLAQPGSSF